ncbi:fluoride efflux transporter FluC [Bacillus sp. JJ722]|uniref:fluoride efflux transporter FluC n=1 Tax=Bacillus sp. JJ722 TaxID=3122973 RepID=UPI002FFD82FC
MNILLVGLGGFLGAVCRYLGGFLLGKYFSQRGFPWFIMLINFVGSFLFGVFYSLIESNMSSLFLFTGFFGAFTTFSTFSLEAIQLWEQKLYKYFVTYMLLTIVGCTLLFSIGYSLFKF